MVKGGVSVRGRENSGKTVKRDWKPENRKKSAQDGEIGWILSWPGTDKGFDFFFLQVIENN